MVVEPVYVVDACAFIALLEDEPGAEIVEEMLLEPNNHCLISAISACEIYYDLRRRGNEEDAESLVSIFAEYNLMLLDRLPPSLWKAAGQLKAQWRRVSLADCFALALTIQESGALVTSDHHELDPIAEANVCPIRFIR
ncbi:MAG TPA: PIN domain-containing protein [Thermoanaerobaculia bacterium]|nr:PIN domain-containing protein [Thermoanaerobaculia bacterium]